MVAFSRLLTGALTFASASIALAAPAGNVTLAERAPVSLSCGADTPPLANMTTPDESQLVVNSAAAVAVPISTVVRVYWSVSLLDACGSPYSRTTPIQECHLQGC